MLSFRTYLKEAADSMLEIIKGLDFTIKSANDREMVVIVKAADRFGAKAELEKILTKSKIEFKDGVKSSSSSDIKTTDTIYDGKKYRFFYKPKGSGGSGAGAEVTALGECFQAYACCARQLNGRPLESGEEVFEILGKGNSKHIDADRTLDQCRKLDAEWIHSGTVIANAFHGELGTGQYNFHRGSKMVSMIEAEYNRLKKQEGIRLNINKWNPADIWVAKDGFKFPTSKWTSLGEYNTWILEQFKGKNLLGVSLKKVPSGKPKKEIYNETAKGLDIKFLDYQIVPARKDFFGSDLSKDVYIDYKDHGKKMRMQIRTFSAGMSGWQGEIKGATAAGGKVGGGNLEEAMTLAGIPPSAFIDQSSAKAVARARTKAANVKMFTEFYKYLSKDKRSIQALIPEIQTVIENNNEGWFYSKFLSMQYLYVILKSGKQDKVMQNIARIAASATDVSSVFYKYS